MRSAAAAYLLASACATPAEPPAVAKAPPPSSAAKAERPAKGALERSFTGQTRPTVLVINGLSRPQHLFVDFVYHAELAPAASVTVELATGVHTVTCSDTRDPQHAPVTVSETFERGFAYKLAVVP